MRTSRTAATSAVFVVAAGIGLAALAGGQAVAQGRGGQGQQGQTQGQTGQQGQAGRGGQQPTRDTGVTTPPATPGTAIISGSVTTAGSGGPVRRARVTLSGPELRGGRSTLTNDEGRFTFAALPAGRFTLTASKAGYVDVPFGAKRPGRPGTPIQLLDKQKLENANIALPKGSVITGMIVDESGEPAPGTQVRVMRFVMRTGERTLQSAGQAQSDDRGFYRVWGLQPGEYLISAVPRNQNISDLRNMIAAEVEMLLQQAQASGAALGGRGGGAGGGAGGGGGGGGGGGRAGGGGGRGLIDQMLGGGRGGNPDVLGRVAQLQQQLAQSEQDQTVAYAPVYYPSTPSPSQSSTITLAIGEERPGVDMQLRLVHTANVEGSVQGVDGVIPQGTQITLLPIDQGGMPPVPGTSTNTARAQQDGKFTFRDVPPGQYRVMARANIRAVDPNAQAAANAQAAGRGAAGGRGGFPGGPGGRGGPGQITEVLWGAADISVSGEDVKNVSVSLQPGMTLTGRVSFEGQAALPPTDLTRVRVNISPRGVQPGLDLGGLPPAEVDASGTFKIKGVPPGRYSLNANAQAGQVPGAAPATGGRGGGAGGGGGTGQWTLKSAMANGRDALDHGLVIEPNQPVSGMLLTFVDRTQEVSGTIQDTLGKPTSDYTIILFAADKSFWQPQARRIQSARPGTDGKFAFRNIPAGDYRITAVTDVEPGDWYDPEFLSAIVSASIPVLVNEGEKKVQDIKVAASGGGH